MIILVDGSHLLHRALSVPELANLSDSLGNTTGGIFGFLNSLSSVAEKYRYQCSFINCFDSGIPVHRRQLFKNYKPNKTFVKEEGIQIEDSLLSDINKQFEETGQTVDAETASFLEKYRFSRTLLHNSILPYLGCLSIRVPNCEADDIISVVADKLKDQEEIVILSSDRDLDQLLDDTVTRYDGIKKEFITRESVIEKQKLVPDQWRKHWLIRKALLGDGCFVGDSMVTMADGTITKIKDLVNKEDFFVKSWDESNKKFITSKGHSARITKNVSEVQELELENGKIVKCTPDHRFLTKNRGWVEAKDLTEEDELIEYSVNRYSEAQKKKWQNKEFREKVSKSVSNSWEDMKIIKKRIEGLNSKLK